MFRILKYALTTLVMVVMAGVFAIFVLDVPLPWKASASETAPAPRGRTPLPAVDLVKGMPHTLEVPEAVRRSLGIRKGNTDQLATAKVPNQSQPLVLPGSTALDPARIVRIRIRFAPAEVVKIPQRRDHPSTTSLESQFRELRPGDEVKEHEELAVFYSVDVGSKKNDLFEAIIQYRLDKVILDRSEKEAGSLPAVFLWNARRNVQTDRSAIIRAKNTLKTWNIPEEDIEAVIKEAEEFNLTENQKTDYKDADWGDKQDKWARVILRSPCNGVIVERNLSKGETVVDNTLNLFTIAQLDKMLVLASLPEMDLPLLENLNYNQRKWTVQTVGVEGAEGIAGRIDEISRIIDPNQHTAVIKGYIDNPGRKIRAGQFVSATVNLPPPADVVEIPMTALVEDGTQSIVFVERDANKNWYTMRRVEVTQRFDKAAYVRSTPLSQNEKKPEEEELGLLLIEPLKAGERVLPFGAMELKAALLEKEAREPKGN